MSNEAIAVIFDGPNVVEFVKASEVRQGDRLLVLTTIFEVVSVTPYNLAYSNLYEGAAGDQVVRTSTATGRWSVLHIMTNHGGLVRFPHEDIARLAHVQRDHDRGST